MAESLEHASPVHRLLTWLRAGYPYGVPQRDYIALFGILHRHLTPEEVEQIAFELYDGEGGLDTNIPRERIREIIRETVLEEPDEADVTRVAGRLAKGGWPLAAPRQATLTGSGAR